MSTIPSVPQYRQIADTLKARIANGMYRAGDRMPASVLLEDMFNVSEITVRKSLQTLAREGWVTGKRGVGTIVSDSVPKALVDIRLTGNFTEWLASAAAVDHDIRQEVLGSSVEGCPKPVGEILGIADGDPAWQMRRLRSIGGDPISYHVNFARPGMARLISEEDFRENGNFVELLRQRFDEPLDRADQHVEARTADMDIAGLLDIGFGAPIFFVENVYVTSSGSVAAVTHLYLRADRYRYSAVTRFADLEQADRRPFYRKARAEI